MDSGITRLQVKGKCYLCGEIIYSENTSTGYTNSMKQYYIAHRTCYRLHGLEKHLKVKELEAYEKGKRDAMINPQLDEIRQVGYNSGVNATRKELDDILSGVGIKIDYLRSRVTKEKIEE